MSNTAKGSLLTEYLIAKLRAADSLELARVYYGDQEQIPEVPAVCVEPAVVLRELDGVPLRTRNEFTVSVLIYSASIEGVEEAQERADQVTEQIIDFINSDGIQSQFGGTAFGGLVIYGYVNSSEYGYVVKDSKLMRANRATVYALSKTNLLEA